MGVDQYSWPPNDGELFPRALKYPISVFFCGFPNSSGPPMSPFFGRCPLFPPKHRAGALVAGSRVAGLLSPAHRGRRRAPLRLRAAGAIAGRGRSLGRRFGLEEVAPTENWVNNGYPKWLALVNGNMVSKTCGPPVV